VRELLAVAGGFDDELAGDAALHHAFGAVFVGSGTYGDEE